MLAIIKREISSYFNSAIGYVVITAYLIFGGFYFYITCLAQNSSNLSYMFSNLFIITLFNLGSRNRNACLTFFEII